MHRPPGDSAAVEYIMADRYLWHKGDGQAAPGKDCTAGAAGQLTETGVPENGIPDTGQHTYFRNVSTYTTSQDCSPWSLRVVLVVCENVRPSVLVP